MFIESITVSGCLGVREASKFVFKRVEEDRNFTELQSKTPISAFTIVFDTKYGADYDFSEFISDRSGVSTVEIVLWQCSRNILPDFKWLKENRMITLRDLKQPENIFINGVKQNIVDFHNAIASFGVTDSGFQMHCLLREEITRLSLYTGDDLWNLIKRINDCEHLVSSLERTHKKQQLLSKCFDEHVKEIEEDILPPNLKLLDDIHEHFKANKKFRTLTRIVDERKLIVLEAENGNIEEELAKTETKINAEGSRLFIQKALIIGNEMEAVLINERFVLICQLQHDLRVEIASHKMKLALNIDSTKQIDEQVATINTLTNSVRARFNRLQDSVPTMFSEEMFVELTKDEIIKWKLALLKTAGSAEFQSILQTIQSVIGQEEKSLSKHTSKSEELQREYLLMVRGIKDDPLPCPEEIEKFTTQHHEHQFASLKSMLELEKNSLDRHGELLQLDVEINRRALTAGLNLEFVETLKTFDAFISGNEAFEIDYLGPMFMYLKKDCDVAHKFKSQVSSAMNIILFICGSTARKVHRSLIESNINIGAYTLLGLDEFVPPKAPNQPGNMDDEYISAESLVADCDFKSTLKKFFRKILLANDNISSECDVANDGMEYITYARSGVVTRTKGCFTFESVLPEVQIVEGINLINESQKIYKKIKVRTNVLKAIMTYEQLQKEGKTQRTKDETLHQSLLESAFSRSVDSRVFALSILEQKLELQKIIMGKSALITAMKCMITEVNQGMEQWNEQVLVDLLQQNFAAMIEAKVLLLRTEVDLKREISILEIELRNSEGQIENFWMILVKASNTNSSQQSLEVLENQLRNFETELGKLPRIDTTKEQLDALHKNLRAIELRKHLYKKNSKKDKTGRALELCRENLAHKSGENFDGSVYEQFHYQPKEIIAPALAQYRQELREKKKTIGSEIATKDHYGHLLEAIRKAKAYSESPDRGIARNTISSKVFPLMNLVIVKQIKDAVNNFQICFNSVMSRFIRNSVLFFYTRGIFDEIKHENFNWENFDIRRLKSIDFVVEWKKERKQLISTACLQKVKGLLLIMHIINYMSIFKFIIIDECIFEGMDNGLVASIRQYLQIVSEFVQVLLVKNDATEPMDTSTSSA